MNLTGKCKEEFEKWYLFDYIKMIPEKDWELEFINQFEITRLYLIKEFYNKKPSEKYGVLIDYFDSVGIEALVMRWKGKYVESIYKMSNDKSLTGGLHEGRKGFKTRPEARTKAIEKANEIRNEQLK